MIDGIIVAGEPMNAIRIHRQLDSQVIDLPEIASLIGKHVEIIVLEEEPRVYESIPSGPKAGNGKGDVIWMSPDFDETPEEFEEYM